MRRRLLLFFLPSVYAPVSIANEALWNCVQNKDSKEWVCVGEKKPVDKTGAEKSSAPSSSSTVSAPTQAKTPVGNAQENPVKEAQPLPSEAVENTPAAVAAEPESVKQQAIPVKNAEPEPAVSKLPVSTKTDRDARQVKAEPTQVAQSPAVSNPKKLLQTETNRPGWTCDTKSGDKNWDCKLVGEDPKGQARIVETPESGISLLTPTFDHGEEQTFKNLKSQLKYDPWQNCTAPSGRKKPGFVSEKDLRDVSPLDINSDYAEIFDNEIYSYAGNVEMTRADQSSVSTKASYDTVSETLDLQGNVYYSDDELALHSESASLNMAANQAKLRNALFISPATPLRGRAKTIYRESGTLTRYKAVTYTSCRPGNQDWVVHASELKLNKTTGQGAARNAWVEFKGTPVFYSPHLSFPIDDRRLSGFLSPSFGHTQRAGITLATPYYWNIAPNYDATIRPRYLSNRGAVLGGEFRYLTETSKGNADMEYMPHDSILNTSRYLLGLKDTSQFTPHISSSLNLNKVSDKTYFTDLGNALSMSTYSSYLISQGSLNYVNNGVSLRGTATSYESIDQAITNAGLPYRTLPRINLNLNHAFGFMPLNTVMDAEYVYFQHSTLLNAQRANVRPSVSFPLLTASAFLTPKLSLQHTQYSLSNPKEKDSAALASNSMSRTLPTFSADTGLYLEKELNFSNRSYLHTIEPRLFYLYTPNTDQSAIPVFDTGLTDFSFNSMFLENRFSGPDRVQDANQLTAALTTRLVDTKSGREKFKLDVGQIAYFRDRKVNLPLYHESLPGYFPDTDKLSNLVTDLNLGLTDHLSVSSGAQWNPHLNRVVRQNLGLHYQNGPGEIINLGYRYRKNTIYPDSSGLRPYDIINSDISFHWPVYNEWSAVGRWSYSLLNNNTQESFIGAEKENCCWRFRVIGRRWISGIGVNSDPNNPNAPIALNVTGIPQTGVFFQIELKGLTGIGTKLEQFFEKQIYGYQAPKDE
ncbi:MAG: LPS assembly protein LptD [Methylobacter sp.]|jgi:LPS-assembly protein|nr:LPS assembly protein LptD [Methylobacter sp.]